MYDGLSVATGNMATAQGFENVEVFTGVQKDGKTPVTGKMRQEWETNMKRILFTSGLPKASWANKVLTFVKGDARKLFEKDTPESMQVEEF